MHACSVVSDAAAPRTAAHRAPLSMGFPGQESWSGLPFPPPRDLPYPGVQPASPVSPALAGGFFTTSTTWGSEEATLQDNWDFAGRGGGHGPVLRQHCNKRQRRDLLRVDSVEAPGARKWAECGGHQAGGSGPVPPPGPLAGSKQRPEQALSLGAPFLPGTESLPDPPPEAPT